MENRDEWEEPCWQTFRHSIVPTNEEDSAVRQDTVRPSCALRYLYDDKRREGQGRAIEIACVFSERRPRSRHGNLKKLYVLDFSKGEKLTTYRRE